MRNEKKALAVLSILEKTYPDPMCGLSYDGDPFRLFVLALLSAQTTDKVVNRTAGAIFARFPSAREMAQGEVGELEEIIKCIGLYNTKAANLRAACRRITDVYGGEIPREMDQLLTLPGVGRKVANLLRGELFDLGGIVADTHCIRICGRLGFTDGKNALKTERVMDGLIPKEKQRSFCIRLVLHGRKYCKAINPSCKDCPLAPHCKFLQ